MSKHSLCPGTRDFPKENSRPSTWQATGRQGRILTFSNPNHSPFWPWITLMNLHRQHWSNVIQMKVTQVGNVKWYWQSNRRTFTKFTALRSSTPKGSPSTEMYTGGIERPIGADLPSGTAQNTTKRFSFRTGRHLNSVDCRPWVQVLVSQPLFVSFPWILAAGLVLHVLAAGPGCGGPYGNGGIFGRTRSACPGGGTVYIYGRLKYFFGGCFFRASLVSRRPKVLNLNRKRIPPANHKRMSLANFILPDTKRKTTSASKSQLPAILVGLPPCQKSARAKTIMASSSNYFAPGNLLFLGPGGFLRRCLPLALLRRLRWACSSQAFSSRRRSASFFCSRFSLALQRFSVWNVVAKIIQDGFFTSHQVRKDFPPFTVGRVLQHGQPNLGQHGFDSVLFGPAALLWIEKKDWKFQSPKYVANFRRESEENGNAKIVFGQIHKKATEFWESRS